jgi:hypothetical protein
MDHSRHVLNSLFSSKEFLAAIVGAAVGGFFAILTQFLSTLWQRKGVRDSERRALVGTLQAMATEVEVFKVKFLDGFERVFGEPDPKTPFGHLPKVASLRQNLSSVFDSNAAVLGQITDAALRRKIVATYVTLKAMVDVVNYYSERREFFENVRYQPNVIGVNEVRGEAETWAGNVRRNIPDLEKEIAELLADIGKHLDGR